MRDLYRAIHLSRSATPDQIRQRLASSPNISEPIRAATSYVLLNEGRRSQYDRVHHAVEQVCDLRNTVGLNEVGFGRRGAYNDFLMHRAPASGEINATASKDRRWSKGLRIAAAALLFMVAAIVLGNDWWKMHSVANLPSKSANWWDKYEVVSDPASVTDPPVPASKKWWEDPSLYSEEPAPVAVPSAIAVVTSVGKDFDDLLPKEQPLPKTGKFDTTAKSKTNNSIVVKASADRHVLVKVERSTGVEVALGFIRAGESHRFNLPIGTYRVKTASGHKWYGPELMFGPDTAYARADDSFPLKKSGEYWTVELIPQRDGNLREVQIQADQF